MNSDYNPPTSFPIGSHLRKNSNNFGKKINNPINSISNNLWNNKNFLIGGLLIGTCIVGFINLEERLRIDRLNEIKTQKIEQYEKQKTFGVILDNDVHEVSENISKIKPTLEKKLFTYVQVGAFENTIGASEEYKKYAEMGLDVDIVPLYKNGKMFQRVRINCYDNKNFLSWFLGESRLKKKDYFTLKREVSFPVYSNKKKIELIQKKSLEYSLDSNLLLAIWEVESSRGDNLFAFKLKYNKKRKKHFIKKDRYGNIDQITAIGDFQMNPKYHGNIKDLITFENNLDAAAKYLSRLDSRFKGDLTKILQRWNGGGNYNNPETRQFVKKVTNIYSLLSSFKIASNK